SRDPMEQRSTRPAGIAGSPLDFREIQVRPVERSEESRYQELMGKHHYLGRLPKISETIWYVAQWQNQWVALLSFSAAAWKCAARDQWIGWSSRHQYDRLKLIANNSRFLILPDWHVPNLGSRVLSLCQKRLPSDWRNTFGHPLILLETFVDPQRFKGVVYRADNWLLAGHTRGFRRSGKSYSAKTPSHKMVFLKPLRPDARELLSRPLLDPNFGTGGTKMTITADQMRSLPQFFADIPDPRRIQGRRHRLATVLAIAAGGILCGMRGYKAIADWANGLGQKARERFKCRVEKGRCIVPSEYVIRDVLIRVDPEQLDRALQRWNEAYGNKDESLAIDGKTMCNAIDEQGCQTHIMSAIGHQTKSCYTQKK
ncbi:MAG: Druantia anti-phage system protein DruA, partial [Syntrophobacteraceae bacterium]